MTVQAFDEVAGSYDRSFTHTAIGQELRKAVWGVLKETFEPGHRVLELNCGTGEDAVWLARQGVRVLATDASPGMLSFAAEKAAASRMSAMIEFLHLDIGSPNSIGRDLEFDGALSDFGGMNCVRDLQPIAQVLSDLIKPGGHLIVVLMGRWCLGEMLWYSLQFRPRSAFRRLLRSGARGRVGRSEVQVWYPSTGTLRRVFGPHFTLRRLMGLGVFLPPSYLQEMVARRQRLFRLLIRIDRVAGSVVPFSYLGDHILFDFERTGFRHRGHQ